MKQEDISTHDSDKEYGEKRVVDMPLVSIITVVYNGVETIEQTIQSVINQSYKNIEYIIIDGASTDGTQLIIEKFRDSLAYYISEKDNGIYDAMNKGIKKARGEIVGIINSDDWYELDAVEHIVKIFMELPDVNIVFGDMNLVDDNGKRKKHNQIPFSHLYYQMSVFHPATFVRKHSYETYGLFDDSYRIAADFELMNRFYNNKLRFAHVGKLVANFRLNGVSNTENSVCHIETTRVTDKYFDSDLFAGICRDNFMKSNAPLFIFGAGEWGKRVITAFKQNQLVVCKCLDNDKAKWGTEIEGVLVSPPEVLKDGSGQVMIALEAYEEDVIEQLQGMYLKDCHLIRLSDCLKKYETAIADRNGKCLEV